VNVVAERALIFDCRDDRLLGIAHLPQPNASDIGIVVVVGGPQYRVGSHRQFVLMARSLAEAGYPVLRFDYRGMGDSAGAMPGFDRVDEDIEAAIDALSRAAPHVKRIVLWGLCDAASACMIYGKRRDARVRGMIVANPWVRSTAGEATAMLKHYYLQRLLQRSFWTKVFTGGFQLSRSLGGLFGTLRRSRSPSDGGGVAVGTFIDRMLQGVQDSRLPLLLLISEKDLTAAEFVELHRRSSAWQHALAQYATFERLSGADHTFSNRTTLTEANARSLRWLQQLAR
jgi:exosortase A-associated hydrolase 1